MQPSALWSTAEEPSPASPLSTAEGMTTQPTLGPLPPLHQAQPPPEPKLFTWPKPEPSSTSGAACPTSTHWVASPPYRTQQGVYFSNLSHPAQLQRHSPPPTHPSHLLHHPSPQHRHFTSLTGSALALRRDPWTSSCGLYAPVQLPWSLSSAKFCHCTFYTHLLSIDHQP